MAEHTLTLTTAQEDALLVLTDQQRLARALPDLTPDAVLLALVAAPLAKVEQEQEVARAGLRDAAQQLPPSFLARLMVGLTAEQIRRFDFLLPRREDDDRG